MPALDEAGAQAVREDVAAVKITLEEVRTHLKEGVTGIGLEDALNDLNAAAFQARQTYGREKSRSGGGDDG